MILKYTDHYSQHTVRVIPGHYGRNARSLVQNLGGGEVQTNIEQWTWIKFGWCVIMFRSVTSTYEIKALNE